MLSMTGFGSGEGQSGRVTVTLELRSVNHRFLDVSLRLASSVAPHEFDIRKFLKDNVARGRVTVAASIDYSRDVGDTGLDPERLEHGIQLIKEVAARLERETGKPQELSLDHLLAVPDFLRTAEPESDTEDIKIALLTALSQAHQGLMKMKKQEGKALTVEMEQRLDTLTDQLQVVEKLAPQAADEIEKRLQERLEKILTDQIDPQRLAQEVALLAEKANINEECERLAIHISHFRNALTEQGQVAKRLNFLLQEMHREVNTMGSKTNLMNITQAVISMKDEVESMREQIQNLE